MLNKILIIRFSSFGDVTQTLSVPSKLTELKAEIHWVTRSDFAPLLDGHPHIHKIWKLNKSEGLSALFLLIQSLKNENFTHIYDAHNNLRSRIICFFLAPPILRYFMNIQFIRKSQKRWKRFLLFQFRKNTYKMPFSGQRDLLEPLAQWGISDQLPLTPQIFINKAADQFVQNLLSEKQIKNYICFAPSAAHLLKRWPMEHWEKLISLNQKMKWLALGGPEDLFIEALVRKFPNQVLNFAGQTNYQQTTSLIAHSKCLVTNDTGVLHIAEQLGHPALALMGPAPFGFPSRQSTKILELNLECRPCSKHGQGPCTNTIYQKCLKEITPDTVSIELQKILGQSSS